MMKKMKEFCKPSDNYLKYRRTLSLLTQGTNAFKAFYSELKYLYKLCVMEEEQWCEEHENCQECRNQRLSMQYDYTIDFYSPTTQPRQLMAVVYPPYLSEATCNIFQH